MFDIGFWELTMIAVVALLVIGPERLPKVARTVGLWAGRMRGFVMSVKADVDRELRADELKRIMEEQARSTGLHDIVEETREALEEANKPDYLVKAMPEDGEKKAAQADDEAAPEAATPAPGDDTIDTKRDHDK